MVSVGIFFVVAAHLLSSSLSQPIVPTFWGTYDCASVPVFSLKDEQPASGDVFETEYGLDDYKPYNFDILIVGLYFADSPDSWDNAKAQQELGEELEDKGYTVKNVALNYFAPLSCVLEGECVNFWWNSPYIFPSYDNCLGYVGGCDPLDERLFTSNWQGLLAAHTTIPIFQDTTTGWIWDEFGGLQGDIYIYDTDGKLSSYLCNIENEHAICDTPLIGGGLKNETSYDTAKKAALVAGRVKSGSRCKDIETKGDDDYYYSTDQEIYYVDDYYYYNGFGTNDESSFGNAISVSRRHTNHKIVHKIPTYVYAAVVALLASFATCLVLFCRWKRNQSRNMLNGGIVRFTQLPTDDDEFVFDGTAVGHDDPNPFRSDSLGARSNDRYGSL